MHHQIGLWLLSDGTVKVNYDLGQNGPACKGFYEHSSNKEVVCKKNLPVINPIKISCIDIYGHGKCELCSGDCDSDSDCVGDLVCFHTSGEYGVGDVPGCSWDPNYPFSVDNWDYCKLLDCITVKCSQMQPLIFLFLLSMY